MTGGLVNRPCVTEINTEFWLYIQYLCNLGQIILIIFASGSSSVKWE